MLAAHFTPGTDQLLNGSMRSVTVLLSMLCMHISPVVISCLITLNLVEIFSLAIDLSNSLTNDENGDTPLTLAIRTYKDFFMSPIQEQDSLKLATSSQSLGLVVIRKLINFGRCECFYCFRGYI